MSTMTPLVQPEHLVTKFGIVTAWITYITYITYTNPSTFVRFIVISVSSEVLRLYNTTNIRDVA